MLPSAFALEPAVGVAGGIHGTVTVISKEGETRTLQGGDPVYLEDRLTTEADGRLQILLLDETVFTVGPESSITVKEFIYDASAGSGKLKADVIKGFFRIISGKIAHQDPENMSVELPAGTIGFRGTMVMGRSEGTRSLVVLLGPAGGEGVRPGRIYVANIVNGEALGVEIDQKGYGTVIEGDNTAPLPAFKVTEEELEMLNQALNADSGSTHETAVGQGEGGNASRANFDSGHLPEAFSLMSQMDEHLQRAAQGGMLTPTPAVTPVTVPGGRDDDGGDK